MSRDFIQVGCLEKHFEIDAEVKQAATATPQTLYTDFIYTWEKTFCGGMNAWKFEVYHLASVCHLYIEVRINVDPSECFITYPSPYIQ
jgi:hypothetical protein